MRRSDDTFLVVVGTIVGIVAVGLMIAGVAVLLVGSLGSEDGWFEGPPVSLSTDGSAVRTERLSLGANPGPWFPDGGAVRQRVTITPSSPDEPVFVGVAQSEDVDRWLADSGYTTVLGVDGDGRTEVEVVEGARSPAPPGDQDFWEVSASGTSPTAIIWDTRFGTWELVVANADGSADVAVAAEGQVRLRLAGQVGWTMVAAAVVVGLVALVMLLTAFRHRRRDARIERREAALH
ncbi:hypothetical protein [Salsipaludibacter albus]|uniref:hypothetical protein n=1 Tax=Salsipaludibacter albus TaxID=2849650 RepID=UPI001EE3D962|nr:hypothetical protein [Salsipaludibacter albus]MBY5161513.1 hypothetical protein [Salsipaludibacter albus]